MWTPQKQCVACAGHGFSTESADQQKSASPTEKQLTPVHSCFGHLSSGAVRSSPVTAFETECF